MKVANKISLSFLITAVILTSISISIVYITVKNKFEEHIFDHLMTAAQSRSNHLETFLEEQKETVEQITVTPTFKELLITSKNNAAYNQKLEQTIEALGSNIHDEFFDTFLLDKNGTIVSSVNRGSIGHDKSNDPYFFNAKEATYIKDVYYSTTTGKNSIAVSSPIIDNKTNQVLGVIVARIETDKLNNITLDRTGLGETGEIYLVNQDYYMITPSRFHEDVVLKQKVDTVNVRNSFLDKKGHQSKHKEMAIFSDYRGVNVVGTHVYIPETKWALIAEIDAKEAFEPLKWIKLIFVAILIVVPIIAWLVGIFVSRMISGPIHKLHKGTEVIASGNLDYKISIDTKDEIGQLSRAFDKMTENLKKTTASVIELNNEIIERQKAEEALKESEEKYRTLFENANEAIYVAQDEMIKFPNPETIKIYGYSKEELTSKPVSHFLYEKDREMVLERHHKRLSGEEVSAVYPFRIITKSGDVKWVELKATSFSWGDRPATLCFLTDITGRKLTEDALRESEERYRTILESIDEGYFEVDLAGNFTFVNDSMCKIRGSSRDELIGMNNRQYMDQQTAERVYRTFNKVYKTGESVKGVEWESIRKDGNKRHVESSISLLKDSKGRPVGFRGVARDVTKRKRAEAAVKRSEEKYRELFEKGSDLLCFHDLEGNLIHTNLAFKREYGWDEEDLVKMNLRDFIPERYRSLFKDYLKRVKEKGTDEGLMSVITKEGRELVIEYKNTLISDETGPIGVQGSARDITPRLSAERALRKSEKRFRTLVEESPLAIALIKTDGRYDYANPKFVEIFGYDLNDIPIGREWFEKAYPDRNYRRQVISAWIKDQEKIKSGETRPRTFIVRCKDGSDKNISFTTVYPERGNQMVIYEDITERMRLEEQLRQSQKMEALGTLAGGVAHDLNNILSGLVSYPELLLMDIPQDSPLRKPILTIQKAGEKTAAIVQDLLTLARRGVTVKETVDLNQIVLEYLESNECETMRSFHSGVQIETRFESHLLKILGSSIHLSKMVMNLVSNAAEAMPDGGRITISTENLYFDRPTGGHFNLEEGDYVHLTVSDTGVGISSEDLKRIFEPFFTKKVMGRSGTGLGMAVVWGTVTDHNGYIDVKSTEGIGTTFALYFPGTREEPVKDTSSIPIEDLMGKGQTILVIDDVEEQREIASGMLKKLGYSVTSVLSGEEAVEYMKNNTVDLLVLDMLMDPGIDGLETYKRILEIHPNQRAIISSGFSETPRVEGAIKLGAGAYVKKPYLIEKIGIAVRSELEK